ncbi:MAG: hypothetical protein WD894_26695 [Pirellulales bacterium]
MAAEPRGGIAEQLLLRPEPWTAKAPHSRALRIRWWLTRVKAGYEIAIGPYEKLGRRAPLRFAAFNVAILFTLVFAIFVPGFDTNDDAVMNMIVAGKGYGVVPDEHMVFSNVLIGLGLKTLYTQWPSFPWYGSYLLAVHFIAQTTMLFCAIRPGYTRLRLRLYLVYFATAGLYFINNLQFTSTAFMAGQSGLLLLMLAVRDSSAGETSRWRLWRACAFAFVLLLVSSLLRREVFYPVVGLAIPTCGLVALAGRRPLFNAVACLSVLAAAFAAATACWHYNNAYYDVDDGWRSFYEYNQVRVKFNDEAWVRYSPETSYLFREVNWSENDFEMLNAWFFDNEERYSLEALRHVLEEYPWQRSRVSGEMFAGSIASVFFDRESLAIFLVLPLLLYCLEPRAVNYAVVGVALAMSCGLIGYLILFSKTPPSRVYVPTLAFPLAVAACLAHSSTFLPPERFRTWLRMIFSRSAGWRRSLRVPLTKYVAAVVLALMCVGVAKGTYHQYRRSRERIKTSNQLYELLATIDASDDKLFVCWAAAFPYEGLRPFDSLQSMSDLHLLVLGWPQKTPLHRRMKEHFAVGDLAEALYRRNDLYLIAHPYYLGLYEEYVREHFGAELRYETPRYAKLFSVTQAIERQIKDRDGPTPRSKSIDERMATPISTETRTN